MVEVKICDMRIGVKRYATPWAVFGRLNTKRLMVNYTTRPEAHGTATMEVTRTHGGYRIKKANEIAIYFNLAGEEVK